MSATATLTYTASLGATKSFNPASVSPGGKSTVTIRLSNGGAVPLTNVSATDPLPAGMLLATPPNAYTTCGGATTVTAAAGGNSASTGRRQGNDGRCDAGDGASACDCAGAGGKHGNSDVTGPCDCAAADCGRPGEADCVAGGRRVGSRDAHPREVHRVARGRVVRRRSVGYRASPGRSHPHRGRCRAGDGAGDGW